MRRNKMPVQHAANDPAVVWWLEVDPVTSQLTRVYRDFPTIGQAMRFADHEAAYRGAGGSHFGLISECPWHPSHSMVKA